MKSILVQCVLVLGLVAFMRGDPIAVAETFEKTGEISQIDRDESNELKKQLVIPEMPILNGHKYPHCSVRYTACKVVHNDVCGKCKNLEKCCEDCFKQGVFCRALSEICFWNNLKCQCDCLQEASKPCNSILKHN